VASSYECPQECYAVLLSEMIHRPKSFTQSLIHNGVNEGSVAVLLAAMQSGNLKIPHLSFIHGSGQFSPELLAKIDRYFGPVDVSKLVLPGQERVVVIITALNSYSYRVRRYMSRLLQITPKLCPLAFLNRLEDVLRENNREKTLCEKVSLDLQDLCCTDPKTFQPDISIQVYLLLKDLIAVGEFDEARLMLEYMCPKTRAAMHHDTKAVGDTQLIHFLDANPVSKVIMYAILNGNQAIVRAAMSLHWLKICNIPALDLSEAINQHGMRDEIDQYFGHVDLSHLTSHNIPILVHLKHPQVIHLTYEVIQ